MRPSSLLPLVTLSLASTALAASNCVAFDITWNLLAFGFNGKDYNAGAQDTWSSGNATDITTTGRPPFNGANTTCYLSQYVNAIYVTGADTANPSSIYIYDATALSWSVQSVTANGYDPSSGVAVLDHDTNVFYALSQGTLFSLDMGALKAANSTALSWNNLETAGITTTGYDPVMVLANNHVFFLDVPGVAAGSAEIFVIHYSWFQPTPQAFGDFPAQHGQAVSFFEDTGVQFDFAFIPDDGSNTYIVNTVTNTTQTLAPPPIKDAQATYFASDSALVQLSSSGVVSYIPFNPGNNQGTTDGASTDTNTSGVGSTSGTWSTVTKLPIAASSTGNPGNTTTPGSSTKSSQAPGSSQTGSTPGGSKNGALTFGVSTGLAIGGGVMFAFALLL